MKINFKIGLIILLKSLLMFSQNDNINSDTIYIKLKEFEEINAKKYKKLVISKDSADVCGYFRIENDNIYYLDNGKEVIIFGKKVKNVTKIMNFGFFGSIKLYKKRDYIEVHRISMAHSHSSILRKIIIRKIKSNCFIIDFIYSDGFGIMKKEKIILQM